MTYVVWFFYYSNNSSHLILGEPSVCHATRLKHCTHISFILQSRSAQLPPQTIHPKLMMPSGVDSEGINRRRPKTKSKASWRSPNPGGFEAACLYSMKTPPTSTMATRRPFARRYDASVYMFTSINWVSMAPHPDHQLPDGKEDR